MGIRMKGKVDSPSEQEMEVELPVFSKDSLERMNWHTASYSTLKDILINPDLRPIIRQLSTVTDLVHRLINIGYMGLLKIIFADQELCNAVSASTFYNPDESKNYAGPYLMELISHKFLWKRLSEPVRLELMLDCLKRFNIEFQNGNILDIVEIRQSFYTKLQPTDVARMYRRIPNLDVYKCDESCLLSLCTIEKVSLALANKRCFQFFRKNGLLQELSPDQWALIKNQYEYLFSKTELEKWDEQAYQSLAREIVKKFKSETNGVDQLFYDYIRSNDARITLVLAREQLWTTLQQPAKAMLFLCDRSKVAFDWVVKHIDLATVPGIDEAEIQDPSSGLTTNSKIYKKLLMAQLESNKLESNKVATASDLKKRCIGTFYNRDQRLNRGLHDSETNIKAPFTL